MILDGNKVAKEIKEEIMIEVERFKGKSINPKLALVRVGDDPASEVYVNFKVNDCKSVGIESAVFHFKESITEEELIAHILKLNADKSIHGILVQVPLPKHIDANTIMDVIHPLKDVDCFNPVNVGLFHLDMPYTKPCTPAGIMEILKRYNIELAGKKAVVIGRSDIVGKPMAQMLTNANCTVTLCHSKTETKDLYHVTSEADIIVCATGKRQTLHPDVFKSNHIIIDVGMHRLEGRKVCGDLEDIGLAETFTPVPGGVGPMTRAMLLKNCIKCCRRITEN